MNTTIAARQLPIADCASVHLNIGALKSNCIIRSVDKEVIDVNLHYPIYTPSSFTITSPRKSNTEYLCLSDHQTPNHDLLFTIYPKAKSVIIQFDKEMHRLIFANWFHKIIRADNKVWLKEWENVRTQFFKNSVDMQDITNDDIENFVSYKTDHHPFPEEYPFFIGSEVGKVMQSNVYFISLKDILFDKDKTLQFIETITEKPIKDSTVTFYDSYIENQKRIWVTLPGYR